MKPTSFVPFLLPFFIQGCQILGTPTPANIINAERSNAITSNSLSLATKSVVLSSGLDEQACLANFDDCLTGVQSTFLTENNKSYLAAAAELHYAHAQRLHATPACQHLLTRPPIDPNFQNAPKPADLIAEQEKAQHDCQTAYLLQLYETLRHSYAYLFYDRLTDSTPTHTIASEEHIRTQDIYHVATHALVGDLYQRHKHKLPQLLDVSTLQAQDTYTPPTKQRLIGRINSSNTERPSPTLHLYLADDPYYLTHLSNNNTLSDLNSVYDISLSDLNAISTNAGLGVGFVGSLDNRYRTQLGSTATDTHIHPTGHLLMTALATVDGATLADVLDSQNIRLHFFNPYHTQTINLFDQSYPLYANFSAGYAKWLEENQFRLLAFANMLNKNSVHLPELFMLEPYNPDKRVILMIHGLASSPKTWTNLTNSLLADPVLRDNYQVWQIFYATNLPILENRYHIQRLITHAFDEVDPHRQHPASQNAVIVAHSMGAVIGRLMLSNDNLLEKLTPPDPKSPKLKHQDDDFLGSRLRLSPLPQVNTAVFISAPFKGTTYADRWFTKGLRQLIQLPNELTQAITGLNSSLHNLYLQNGASQLSDQSDFIKLTQDVAISPTVLYHLIMANNTNTEADIRQAVSQDISDGIVPYASSYLEGADSEIIIDGKHNVHANPKTVLHLREILHRHLKD